MLTRRIQILFDNEEYQKLKRIAQKEKKTIGAIIRESVSRVYFGKKRSKFGKLRAFGMWADRAETDQELLDTMAGTWKQIPLREE